MAAGEEFCRKAQGGKPRSGLGEVTEREVGEVCWAGPRGHSEKFKVYCVKAGGSHQRILSRGDDTIQFIFLKSPCSPSRNSASVLWQDGPPEPVEKKQGRREGTSGGERGSGAEKDGQVS